MRFPSYFKTGIALIAIIFPLAVGHAVAESAPCARLTHDGRPYVVCSAEAGRDGLRLFWKDATGKPFGGFGPISAEIGKRGEALAFAMNAGMYQTDLSPVGLHVEAGKELHKANTRSGPGNFHMKPNGVFYVGAKGAGVMETGRYLATTPAADYATQSGPMLVIDGKIHPKIRATGESEKVRNGVGVAGSKVMFAISEEAVTFHEFASLFRDRLGCRNALFLDGSISSLHAPNLGRSDWLMPMGPIVGVVKKAK